MADIALGLHGGCGTLDQSLQSAADWAESRQHMANALRAGWSILRSGGSALDAVQATVVVLEDSPHFNAGYGAALTEAAEHELDASIMDGATLAAGAVCTLRRTRNPVKAARAVLDSGRAVLLGGVAADRFAELQGNKRGFDRLKILGIIDRGHRQHLSAVTTQTCGLLKQMRIQIYTYKQTKKEN